MPDANDKLKVSKITDKNENMISVVYSYKYEIDEQEFEQNVEFDVEIGVTKDQKVILRLERVDGNQLYYKKIVKDIKNKCFGL